MKIYHVFQRPDGLPVLVRQGFTKRVLCLGPLGLLWLKAWISALIFGGGVIILVAFCPHAVLTWLLPGLFFILASFTSELRRWELLMRGYTDRGALLAPSLKLALMRWLDRRSVTAVPPEWPCASS